jgi:hypothetical protein
MFLWFGSYTFTGYRGVTNTEARGLNSLSNILIT